MAQPKIVQIQAVTAAHTGERTSVMGHAERETELQILALDSDGGLWHATLNINPCDSAAHIDWHPLQGPFA